MKALPEGVRLLPGYFDHDQQRGLVETIRDIVREAPLYRPVMPRSGQKMSVRMTNCGSLGWVTDQTRGYRYQPTHPETGFAWPSMPALFRALWQDVSDCPLEPEAGLINFYDETAKMGLHQDKDEAELTAPVVSISLGDSCLFRIGGLSRSDKTQSFRLESGDVLVLGGPSRLRFHGVDRIYPGTSMVLKQPGRINVTLRRVTRP